MAQQVFDLEKFNEQGYLVARDVLDPEVDLGPVFTEYEELLERISHMWYDRGDISDMFEGLPFNERLVKIAVATRGNYYPHIDISFTQTDVEDKMPVHTGPAVFNLLRSPRLLDAVEQFIGPEIYSNPVQHVRIKPPESALPEGDDQRRFCRVHRLAPGPGRHNPRRRRIRYPDRLDTRHRGHGGETAAWP